MLRSEFNIGVSKVGIFDYEPLLNEPETIKEQNPLYSLIFTKDSRGVLTGDLGMFLSPKTNNEVRQFIEENLLNENASEKGLSLPQSAVNELRENISDDDIANFSRNHGESAEQYAYRIGKFFADEKAKNVSLARFEREKQRLSDLGFNFD